MLGGGAAQQRGPAQPRGRGVRGEFYTVKRCVWVHAAHLVYAARLAGSCSLPAARPPAMPRSHGADARNSPSAPPAPGAVSILASGSLGSGDCSYPRRRYRFTSFFWVGFTTMSPLPYTCAQRLLKKIKSAK